MGCKFLKEKPGVTKLEDKTLAKNDFNHPDLR